jgi:hypothetical protein
LHVCEISYSIINIKYITTEVLTMINILDTSKSIIEAPGVDEDEFEG